MCERVVAVAVVMTQRLLNLKPVEVKVVGTGICRCRLITQRQFTAKDTEHPSLFWVALRTIFESSRFGDVFEHCTP